MPKTKKSWTEKLRDSKDLPKVVKLKRQAAEHWHGETMVVPAPAEVNEVMRKVPKGKLITIHEIRETVAKKHKTDIGCPLTCGIFAWISAHAAEEQRQEGEKRITPWWRTLKDKGILNEKYPGGGKTQKKLLEEEGHKVVKKGKKLVVEGYQQKLFKTA